MASKKKKIVERKRKQREPCISLSVKRNIMSRDDFHPSYSLYNSKACDWLVTGIRKEFTSKIHKKISHVEPEKTEEISHHTWAGAKFAQGNVLCEFRTTRRCCANFAQAWSSCLPKAISSSFQLQIIHDLKRWILTS